MPPAGCPLFSRSMDLSVDPKETVQPTLVITALASPNATWYKSIMIPWLYWTDMGVGKLCSLKLLNGQAYDKRSKSWHLSLAKTRTIGDKSNTKLQGAQDRLFVNIYINAWWNTFLLYIYYVLIWIYILYRLWICVHILRKVVIISTYIKRVERTINCKQSIWPSATSEFWIEIIRELENLTGLIIGGHNFTNVRYAIGTCHSSYLVDWRYRITNFTQTFNRSNNKIRCNMRLEKSNNHQTL